MAEFLGAFHLAGRPVLHSLQPLNLFVSQWVEQRITTVKSASDKRMYNLFRRSTGRVAPDLCIIFRRLAIAELHIAVTCDNILRILSHGD